MDIHRPAESQILRNALSGPAPRLTLLLGPDGGGRSTVVRHATRGMEVVRYWAAPLGDADQRALLVGRLGRWRDAPTTTSPLAKPMAPLEPLPTSADWPRILDHLWNRAGERTGSLRLLIEEFPRLIEARPKLIAELERFWAGVRARGYPVHLVLVGAPHAVFDRMMADEGSWAAWIGNVILVEPLTYREVGSLFSAYPSRERLLAWMVFGGFERHLRACEPDVTLATNVRQVILSPGAPLLREGFEQLQRSFQTVERYASLLRSLAGGRREWGEILAGTPELGTGGQMAPYLARLQQLGIVAAEASLDARPGSRSRRYRIVDPFVSFWHRFVLPNLTEILGGRGNEVWRTQVRPHLDKYAASLFPVACRQYLARYAHERLPATARELGGLWGSDYDIEVAGTLRTGAAVYGRALWESGRIPEAVDEGLQDEMKRTRYGFGREARLRLLFSTDGFSSGLVRRGARSDVMHLLGVDALFSD